MVEVSPLRGRPETPQRAGIVTEMAVATEREYGLFINGESTESAAGELRELREPATGEPLAKSAVANEQDVDRAVEAARAALDGDWGRTAPDRALAPSTRAGRRARRQPQGAR